MANDKPLCVMCGSGNFILAQTKQEKYLVCRVCKESYKKGEINNFSKMKVYYSRPKNMYLPSDDIEDPPVKIGRKLNLDD